MAYENKSDRGKSQEGAKYAELINKPELKTIYHVPTYTASFCTRLKTEILKLVYLHDIPAENTLHAAAWKHYTVFSFFSPEKCS